MPSKVDSVLSRLRQWQKKKTLAANDCAELLIKISLTVVPLNSEFLTRLQTLTSEWSPSIPEANLEKLLSVLDQCYDELSSCSVIKTDSISEIEAQLLREISVNRNLMLAFGDAADCGPVHFPRSVPAFAENDRSSLLARAKEAWELKQSFQLAHDAGMGFPFDCEMLAILADTLQLVAFNNFVSIADWFSLETARKRCRLEAIRLARWISFTNSLPMPPASSFYDPLKQRESLTTESGNFVFAEELTREVRPCRDWRIILEYSKENEQIEIMSRSSFYQRIKGESGSTIDAVKVGRGYQLRTDQLPAGAKTEALRNDIIKQAKKQKRKG